MTDMTPALTALRRPRLLIRAAQHGLADYDRNRDLKRVLRFSRAPSPADAVTQLLDTEAELESERVTGAATYCISRHVDVMIAILCEMRLLARLRAA